MDKKEKLLNAALKLFNIYGFDNTPTSRISKEAGVATGTLFNYFESKEELINVLYLRCKDSLVNRLIIELDSEISFRSKLRRIYKNYLDWSIVCTGEFLFFQQFSNSPYIMANTREQGLAKFKGFANLIRDGIEQDVIKAVDMEYLAVLIISIFNANANYLIENQKSSLDKEFLESSFNFIWDSIRR